MDPMHVEAEARRGGRMASLAAQNVTANRFMGHSDVGQIANPQDWQGAGPRGHQSGGAGAGAFLFGDESHGRAFKKRTEQDYAEEGIQEAARKKRAASPGVGPTGSNVDIHGPLTGKMRSGKSVEPRGIPGGRAQASGAATNVAKNYAYKQRVKHFADPDDYRK